MTDPKPVTSWQQINRRKQLFPKHCIEGEYVSIIEIAQRLELTETLARTRMQRERAKPGPVTWEGLGRGKA